MISLLSRIFIKNRGSVSEAHVRRAYGTLCGVVGICLNIMLFALKYFAGTISGSIAITADAFNNLSDAGSSVITLVGFALAGKKPDSGHPFGHGRIEYISGLAVSAVIVVMGAELGRSSIAKILSPEPIQAGLLPGVILLISIGVKIYMYFYNRSVGKKISSAAMCAAAADSLSDSAATAVVLISMTVAHFSGINIDPYAGVLVACFIIYTGISAAKDTVSPLLGQAPDPELVARISDIVLSHPEIEGMHDLIVHDYGPGRLIISLHAEVDGNGNIFRLHDSIDNIEWELKEKLRCTATVHMDPIETNNERLSSMRSAILEKLRTLDPAISVHDFRMVPGTSHTNLIFDAVLPFSFKLSDAQASELIRRTVAEAFPDCNTIVNIDRAYS